MSLRHDSILFSRLYSNPIISPETNLITIRHPSLVIAPVRERERIMGRNKKNRNKKKDRLRDQVARKIVTKRQTETFELEKMNNVTDKISKKEEA